MKTDAFSCCHPAVNFSFFVGAIGFGVVLQHPAYLIAGALEAAAYYLTLHGPKGWKIVLALLPMFLVLTAINPLLNTQGQRVLCHVLGRPYTLEALLYGAAIAGVFVVMMLWFGCYNAVMTSDKFTSLFGNWIPALSLLLTMVLRMIPSLIRKARQITGARKSIGKGTQGGPREQLAEGMTALSTLTSWALEGSVVSADSMRSRGYGTGKHSSFQIYTMKLRDWVLLAGMVVLAAMVIIFCALGTVAATYIPEFYIAPVSGCSALGLIAYCCFCAIPTVLHMKEAVQWHISRSKI